MIRNIIYTLLANAAALYVTDLALDSFTIDKGFLAYIITALTLGVLNLVLKPLLNFFSFPLVFLTGGLFLIAINAFLIFLTQYFLQVMDIPLISLRIDGLLTYLLAAIIFGLANSFINWLLKE